MKCPKCSRRRVRATADGKYKCRKCRTTWKVTKRKYNAINQTE